MPVLNGEDGKDHVTRSLDARHQGRLADAVFSSINGSVPLDVRRLTERMQRHCVDGSSGHVAWRTLGAGRPLVLLHGGHGNWLHWVRNMEALAADRMVCVPDMPGYGESDLPADASMGSLVRGLQHSAQALLGHGAEFDLVGFSFGGLVAAHLAVAFGGVRRLALVGTAGHGGPRRPRHAGLVDWREAASRGDEQSMAAAMRHNLLAHMLHQPTSVDPTALHVHAAACVMTRFHSKRLSRSAALPALLPHAAHDLLLVWGEHDVTADPQQAARDLSSCHPCAQTAILKDAGHWVQYESADVVNAFLSAWLNHDFHQRGALENVRN